MLPSLWWWIWLSEVDVRDHSYLKPKLKEFENLSGRIRLTAREYEKPKSFKSDFILSLVTNLDDIPKLVLIDNPLNHFEFQKEHHKKMKS